MIPKNKGCKGIVIWFVIPLFTMEISPCLVHRFNHNKTKARVMSYKNSCADPKLLFRYFQKLTENILGLNIFIAEFV